MYLYKLAALCPSSYIIIVKDHFTFSAVGPFPQLEKILYYYQSHKKRSSDNISQITIFVHIYEVKNGTLGIKLFLRQKFSKPSGIKFVPNAWFNI